MYYGSKVVYKDDHFLIRSCAKKCHLLLLLCLVSRCLNTATTDTGLTGLMVAITAGHQACVEEMLKQGARLDMVDANGDTAYHKAVIYCPDTIEVSLLHIVHKVICTMLYELDQRHVYFLHDCYSQIKNRMF